MNKAELVDRVAERSGSTKGNAADAVDAVLGAIGDGVSKDGEVRITGFGIFSRKTLKAREGRNPATGAAITIPAKTTVKFKAGKDLEARV